jgi:hypothetical protein
LAVAKLLHHCRLVLDRETVKLSAILHLNLIEVYTVCTCSSDNESSAVDEASFLHLQLNL